MRRRVFCVGLGASMLLLPGMRVSAQTGATQTGATHTQIELALAAASLAALQTRYGESYPDVVAARARVASLRTSLEEAQARHEAIDVAAVSSALEGELADVNARLGEFSARCGSGHPDMDTARARAATLTDAIAHVTSEGVYLGPP